MKKPCQNCLTRDATVHLTEILEDQEKRELHLCEQCAAEQQQGPVELMSLLSSAFTPPEASTSDPMSLHCAECGLQYREFRARGRLGCPSCYEVFRAALEPLLEKIHGGETKHVGKAPDAASAVDRTLERKLVELRRKLQAAVRKEDYEEAARLRDELRQAEVEAATAVVGGSEAGEEGGDDDAGG